MNSCHIDYHVMPADCIKVMIVDWFPLELIDLYKCIQLSGLWGVENLAHDTWCTCITEILISNVTCNLNTIYYQYLTGLGSISQSRASARFVSWDLCNKIVSSKSSFNSSQAYSLDISMNYKWSPIAYLYVHVGFHSPKLRRHLLLKWRHRWLQLELYRWLLPLHPSHMTRVDRSKCKQLLLTAKSTARWVWVLSSLRNSNAIKCQYQENKVPKLSLRIFM